MSSDARFWDKRAKKNAAVFIVAKKSADAPKTSSQ